jgi:hypothetical protein
MIPRLRVVVTPAIGPDLRRPQSALACAKNDAQGFVVEN